MWLRAAPAAANPGPPEGGTPTVRLGRRAGVPPSGGIRSQSPYAGSATRISAPRVKADSSPRQSRPTGASRRTPPVGRVSAPAGSGPGPTARFGTDDKRRTIRPGGAGATKVVSLTGPRLEPRVLGGFTSSRAGACDVSRLRSPGTTRRDPSRRRRRDAQHETVHESISHRWNDATHCDPPLVGRILLRAHRRKWVTVDITMRSTEIGRSRAATIDVGPVAIASDWPTACWDGGRTRPS